MALDPDESAARCVVTRPVLPKEIGEALDALVDLTLEVGRDPMRVVEGAEARTALVRAIDRALRGARGEATS